VAFATFLKTSGHFGLFSDMQIEDMYLYLHIQANTVFSAWYIIIL